MDVNEAVQIAKSYVADLYADEPVRHIGVEEVVFDAGSNAWKVTIGFFRSWDEKTGLSAVLGVAADGEPGVWRRRSFKVVQIDGSSGEVQSMTHRSLASAG